MGILLGLLVGISSRASAQVSGSFALESDYRYRGHSVTAGRGAAVGQLSYDAKSGLYLNLSGALAMMPQDDLHLMNVVANAGYARRLSPALSVDAGLLHSRYPYLRGGYGEAHYSEIYIGLQGRHLTSRLYFSPDYYAPGVRTLYAEVEGGFAAAGQLQFNLHVGRLTYIRRPYARMRDQYDWRLTGSRRLGAFDLHIGVSGGGPDKDYYAGARHAKTALTGGVTWYF